MEHKLIVEVNEQYNFKKITCTEGHYITNWNKEDIKEYHATKLMYAPMTINLDEYYCLTEEEHNEYVELQKQAIKEDEEKRNKELSTHN